VTRSVPPSLRKKRSTGRDTPTKTTGTPLLSANATSDAVPAPPEPQATTTLLERTLIVFRAFPIPVKMATSRLGATGPDADRKLAELRELYAPYVASLSTHLMMPLSGWVAPERTRFNWQTTAWARTGDDGVH